MNVEQWLGRARGITREIEILEQSRKAEYDRVTSIASQLSGTAGTSASPDPHKFDRLAEYADELLRREQSLLEVKAEVSRSISAVEDDRYRKILHLRYCDCMSWREIQREMHYSKSGCFKVHGEAVAYLSGMLSCSA